MNSTAERIAPSRAVREFLKRINLYFDFVFARDLKGIDERHFFLIDHPNRVSQIIADIFQFTNLSKEIVYILELFLRGPHGFGNASKFIRQIGSSCSLNHGFCDPCVSFRDEAKGLGEDNINGAKFRD